MFSSHTYTLLCGLLNGKNMAKKPDLMSWLKYTIFKLFLFIPQTGIIDSSRLPSKFAPSSDFNPLCVVSIILIFRFYLPKFLMVGTLWFAALTMALLQESNELRDPSFSYQINTAHYKNFQVCTYSPDCLC